MKADECFSDGIDGDSGDYLIATRTFRQISQAALSRQRDADREEELEALEARTQEDHLGPREGIDPRDLSQAGWGVVFARDADPAVREALGELLDHRRRQASRHHEFCYREFTGGDGYLPGEAEWDFLDRHQAGFGAADPKYVPYYLLLAGSPEEIPYRFQYDLGVEYAVGRLHFDTPDEYAAYARAIVASETGPRQPAPRAAFFGVRQPGDLATEYSHDFLIEPLGKAFAQRVESPADWRIETHLAQAATKDRLAQLLGGDKTPALLLGAGHGLSFSPESPRQLPHQGAVLCQDWPGRRQWGRKAIPQDFYFAGDDLAADACPAGLIAFFHACYGAGTPKLDAFAHVDGSPAARIAPCEFVAGLPRRLLGHPRGGALAMVGHVERAWSFSYLGLRGGSRLGTFEDTLKRLMAGHPVGSAMEYFSRRYATMSVALARELERIHLHGKIADEAKLSSLWTARNDARNYVIFGDPAVRLPLAVT